MTSQISLSNSMGVEPCRGEASPISYANGGFSDPLAETVRTTPLRDNTAAPKDDIARRGLPSRFEIKQEVLMSEKIELEAMSRRRMLSGLGLVAAASLAVPATMLTATEAEAVVGRPLSPGSVAGVARRQNRRAYKKKKKK